MSNQADRRKRVVLVDDSTAVRDRLAALLRGDGVEVLAEAGDVPTAVEAIIAHDPDCVVLDLNLGTGTGFDVLRAVQKRRRRPSIVVLSNHSGDEYRRQASALGATAFLDKSTEFPHVLDAVRAQVDHPAAGLSDAGLRRVLESVSDAVLLMRPDFVVTFSSHPITPVLGYRPGELVGVRALDLVHPDDQSRAIAALSECVREPDVTVRTELRVRARDDSWGQVEAVLVNRTSDPLVNSLVVTLRDTARRHEVEDALAETTRKLSMALEASQTAIFEWDFVSNRFAMGGGWRHGAGDEELPNEADFSRWASYIHPDDLPAALAHVEAARRGSATEFHSMFRARRLDGQWRWLSIRSEIERAPDGSATRMRGAAIDVTELKRVEENLRASEAVANELIEQAPAAMLVLEGDGTIVAANVRACDLMRRSRAQLIGRNIEETFDPRSRAEASHHLEELARSGSLVLERELLGGDGTTVIVESAARRLPDGRIQSVMQDVTARRELDARQRQAQKLEALGQLTGGIAHDFNNLLTVIISETSLVLQDMPDEHPHRGAMKSIRSAAWSGAAMVKRLTGFARSEPLERKATSPAVLLREIARSLSHILPATISVTLDARSELPDIYADPIALEQILLNLATNARDAMPDGGTFVLTARSCEGAPGWNGHPEGLRGRFVRIAASDSGIGMDQDTKERIFEPFFSTKPRNEGTGLGLAMVYGLMKQHQGAIAVVSAPGTGTSVELYFPVAEAA